MGDLSAQELTNAGWAFAKVDLSNVHLFCALARAAEWRIGNFHEQELANMAWAFATVGYTQVQNESIKFHINPKISQEFEAMCPSEIVQFSKPFQVIFKPF